MLFTAAESRGEQHGRAQLRGRGRNGQFSSAERHELHDIIWQRADACPSRVSRPTTRTTPREAP